MCTHGNAGLENLGLRLPAARAGMTFFLQSVTWICGQGQSSASGEAHSRKVQKKTSEMPRGSIIFLKICGTASCLIISIDKNIGEMFER